MKAKTTGRPSMSRSAASTTSAGNRRPSRPRANITPRPGGGSPCRPPSRKRRIWGASSGSGPSVSSTLRISWASKVSRSWPKIASAAAFTCRIRPSEVATITPSSAAASVFSRLDRIRSALRPRRRSCTESRSISTEVPTSSTMSNSATTAKRVSRPRSCTRSAALLSTSRAREETANCRALCRIPASSSPTDARAVCRAGSGRAIISSISCVRRRTWRQSSLSRCGCNGPGWARWPEITFSLLR